MSEVLQSLMLDVHSARACLSQFEAHLKQLEINANKNEADDKDVRSLPNYNQLPRQTCSTDCACAVQTIVRNAGGKSSSIPAALLSTVSGSTPMHSLWNSTNEFETVLCEWLHTLRGRYAAEYSTVHHVLPDDNVQLLQVQSMQFDQQQGLEPTPRISRNQSYPSPLSTSVPAFSIRPAPPSSVPQVGRRAGRAVVGHSREYDDSSNNNGLQFDDKGKPILPESYLKQRAEEERAKREAAENASSLRPRVGTMSVNHPFATEEFKSSPSSSSNGVTNGRAPAFIRAATVAANSSSSSTTNPPPTMNSRFPALINLHPVPPPPPTQPYIPSDISLPWLVSPKNASLNHSAASGDSSSHAQPNFDWASFCEQWMIQTQIPRSWTLLTVPPTSIASLSLSHRNYAPEIRRRECIVASLYLLSIALDSFHAQLAVEREKSRAALVAHECADLRLRGLMLDMEAESTVKLKADNESLSQQVLDLQAKEKEQEQKHQEELKKLRTTLHSQSQELAQARTTVQQLQQRLEEKNTSMSSVVVEEIVPKPTLGPSPLQSINIASVEVVTVAQPAAVGANPQLVAVGGAVETSTPTLSSIARAAAAASLDTASDMLDSRGYILELENQLKVNTATMADMKRELKELRARIKVVATRETDAQRKLQTMQLQQDIQGTSSKKPVTKRASSKNPIGTTVVQTPAVANDTTDPASTTSDTVSDAEKLAQAVASAVAASEKKSKSQIQSLQSQFDTLQSELKSLRAASATATQAAAVELSTLTEKHKEQLRKAQSKTNEAVKQMEELKRQLQEAEAKAKQVESTTEATSSPTTNEAAPPKVKRLKSQQGRAGTKLKKKPSETSAGSATPVVETEDNPSGSPVSSSPNQSVLFFQLQKQYETLENSFTVLSAEKQALHLQLTQLQQAQSTPAATSNKSNSKDQQEQLEKSPGDLDAERAAFQAQLQAWTRERDRFSSQLQASTKEMAVGQAEARKVKEELQSEREAHEQAKGTIERLQRRMRELVATPSKPTLPTDTAQPSATVTSATAVTSADEATSPLSHSKLSADHLELKKKFNALHARCTEALRKLKIFEQNCHCDALKDQQHKMKQAIMEAFRSE